MYLSENGDSLGGKLIDKGLETSLKESKKDICKMVGYFSENRSKEIGGKFVMDVESDIYIEGGCQEYGLLCIDTRHSTFREPLL